MKKITAIILLLAMALCLCACGDNNKEPRFIGTWLWEDNKTGATATLILNEDGTASFEMTGENAATYDFTWTAESSTSVVVKWAGTPVKGNTNAQADAADEAVDATEAVELPEAPGTVNKRNDPTLVGTGSLKVVEGEMWLAFAEGTNTDILVFTYALKKIA